MLTTSENVKKTADSYNDVPYISKSFFDSTPARHKIILSLFGFDAPNVENARILEIGCSFGGNIIPIALENPNAEIIGIDLSKVQIQEGKNIIKSLGLKNIKLQHKNILKFTDKGKFDYIICHGVFSWVNEEVQDGILSLVKNYLSENGVAYISYNTYPGWKNNDIIRDIMLFRAGYTEQRNGKLDGDFKVDLGKDALELIEKFGHPNDHLRKAMEYVKGKSNYYLLHEYFEQNNEPMYLIDFANKLEKHGLMHIVDSEIANSFPQFDTELKQRIAQECNHDHVLMEQYWDYLTNRQFRKSLITHSKNKEQFDLSGNIQISDIDKLHFRGSYIKVDNKYYRNNELVSDNGTSHLLDLLTAHYPNSLSTAEIKESLEDGSNLYNDLMTMIYSKKVELFHSPVRILKQDKLTLAKKYYNYISYFANNSEPLISFAGYRSLNNYDLSDLRFQTMLLCDGTRTDEDILQWFLQQVENGRINVTVDEGSTVERQLAQFILENRQFIESNLMNVD